MLLNVVSTGGSLELYAREQTTRYSLQISPTDEGLINLNTETEVVGTVEVEEILSFGPSGEIETVKLNGQKYNFAGVNPFANKVVFDDGYGQLYAVSF